MAHEIKIPLSIEFRAANIAWSQARARIVGWWKQQGDTVDEKNLIAEITQGGTERTYKFPVAQLPESERKQFVSVPRDAGADETVRQICSAFQPEYLVHSCKTHIAAADLKKSSRPADVWEMRDDFMRLNPDVHGAMEFLGKWGRWRSWRNYVEPSELLRLQRAAREALIDSPRKWFAGNYAFPPMVRSRLSKYPYVSFLTDACEAAIRITVTTDLLQRLEFRVCARPDCALPFPVRTKHKRDYCSQYCAHLESVRRGRKATPPLAKEPAACYLCGNSATGQRDGYAVCGTCEKVLG